MDRILLVIPEYYDVELGQRYYEMPLGLAYINAAFRKAKMNITCLNLNHLPGADRYRILYDKIKTENISYILCGAITPFFKSLQKVFNCAKKANPNIVTIGGETVRKLG